MLIRRGEPFLAHSGSPAETRRIGRALGNVLGRGDTVFIYGDVGAGKTVFVSGIASALGIGGHIQSPTYTIASMYLGDALLYHFDAYRIESPAELFETGFFDCSGGDCVVAVEWADRIAGAKPDGCIEVWLGAVDGDDGQRTVKIAFG